MMSIRSIDLHYCAHARTRREPRRAFDAPRTPARAMFPGSGRTPPDPSTGTVQDNAVASALARVVMADDDADDRRLFSDAFAIAGVAARLECVVDAENLLDRLYWKGAYEDRHHYPRPALVLLDLNMPRMGGRAALAEIKADPALRGIAVIVLTTSRAREDALRARADGCDDFIIKPSTFGDIVALAHALDERWLRASGPAA